MNKKPTSVSTKKPLPRRVRLLIGLVILLLIMLWVIFTAILPITNGNGVDNYQGLQKEMAENIVSLTQLQNGPPSPSWVPDSAYLVRVEDIHPTTKEEITQYCANSHPSYISDDPLEARYYTIVITEQYLFTFSSRKTMYVGCNPMGHTHTEVFGIPEEIDTRYRPPRNGEH